MTLSTADVEYIAHLARLKIEQKDLELYSRNLTNILALAEQMNSVDTQDVKPMAHPLNLHQRLREDVISEVDQREHFQKNAPQVEAGLYLVPQVIE